MQMGSIEEKTELESDEEIPFSTSLATRKVHSFDFEISHIGPHTALSTSWFFRKIRAAHLRSIYIVLIKAKINMLLPFGPLAILLHYLTNKHVRIPTPLIVIFASLQLSREKYVNALD